MLNLGVVGAHVAQAHHGDVAGQAGKVRRVDAAYMAPIILKRTAFDTAGLFGFFVMPTI
jgi:hypothetical protein